MNLAVVSGRSSIAEPCTASHGARASSRPRPFPEEPASDLSGAGSNCSMTSWLRRLASDTRCSGVVVSLRGVPGLVIGRRMPPGEYPMGADDQGVRIVGQVQQSHGSATARRQSDDANAVFGPSKMVGPTLSPGIEQGHFDVCVWVSCRSPVGFVAVAQRTA